MRERYTISSHIMTRSIRAVRRSMAVGAVLAGAFFVGPVPASAANIDAVQAQLAQLVAQVQALAEKVEQMSQQTGAVLGAATAAERYMTLSEVAGSPKVSCTVPVLKPGSRGNTVVVLQMALKEEGSYPEGYVTGYYGKLTQAAVERFQIARGFEVTGAVDEATAKELNALAEKIFQAECTESKAPAPNITVSSPRSGESWRVGGTYRIAWTTRYAPTSSPTTSVAITLHNPYPACLDANPPCAIAVKRPYVIAERVNDSGTFSWTIPASLPQEYVGSAQITVSRLDVPFRLFGRSGPFKILAGATTTTSTVGNVNASIAPPDSETEAGMLVAGREQVLAKVRFTATGEDMAVRKLRLLVNDRNNASYRTGVAADEVPVVKLYDTNGAMVGNAGGYMVQSTGGNAGVVAIENLNWNIPRDTSKTLVVRGVLNTISSGTDSGARVYAHLMSEGFEALGARGIDRTIQAVSGFEKVVYKTKPTVTVASTGATLGATLTPVIRFTVTADSAEQVSWKKVQLQVSMQGAAVAAADAAPGVNGNVSVNKIGEGINLGIQRAFSGPTAQGGQNVPILGGATGYVTLVLRQEEIVPAGASKTYEVRLTFQDVCAYGPSCAVASTRIYVNETQLMNAQSAGAIEGPAVDGVPAFIWSDNSAVGHSENTPDWANGVYVKFLPSDLVSIHN